MENPRREQLMPRHLQRATLGPFGFLSCAVLVESEARCYRRMLLSPTMIQDHLPDQYVASLLLLAEAQLRAAEARGA